MKLKKQEVLAITALISCLFGLLGFSIISFFAYSSLNEYAKQGLTSISSQIEAILSDTVNSYKIQLGKHANSCEQLLLPARKLILRTPYLQPVFDQNGQLAGCEVLVRWFHHKKGMIAPDMFIHSAEKSAQIDEIFTHLLKEVTNKFYPVQSLIPDGFHTAFNVRAPQLLSSNLIHDCKKFIYSLNKCNHQLVIELTERVEIPDSLEYISTIDKLKSMGVKIALDDFGTGHSSLRYIKKIKI
ncbi:MAG: EAL domain-containing protein, partial [Psychromonas sp.]|nr:EAL domain-containing protein [Psychromonas sp.]